MSKTHYILLLIVLLCACEQTNPKSDNHENSKQTIQTADTSTTKQATEQLSELERIEKENSESILSSGDVISKAFVLLQNGDSTIHLSMNKYQDHRIFGYAQPDVTSERLLLLSVFTTDVENNPFGCKLGAYYDIARMDELTLKYVSITGNFVKAIAIDKTNHSTTIYFEKKWIDFE